MTRSYRRAKAAARFAAVLCAAVSLSGCASFWEREYFERSPHLVQEVSDFQSSALTANSYDSLKSVIINVIRSGMEEAVIRVTDYPGDLTFSAVGALLNEIQTKEPVGAYAVEYLSFDRERVLTQYTITLNITYKRVDISAIVPVNGKAELAVAVGSVLRDYKTRLTAEMMLYFNTPDYDMSGMALSYYYAHPVWAMDLPEMETSIYPAAGEALHRIVELNLTYHEPEQVLRQKSAKTDISADAVIASLQLPSDGDADAITAQTLLLLHDTLCDTVRYDSDTAMDAVMTGERLQGDSYTAYGALVENLAVSEGYALAFKLLCDKLEIPCHVVKGLWNGYDHAWNLARIGGDWVHIDTAHDDRGALFTYEAFFLNDEDAAEASFNWDRALYPAAASEIWNYDSLILTQTEPPAE